MASKDDILRVRTSLKYGWAWKPIADAISLFADGTTKTHIFGNIDGDKPIRPHKDLVMNKVLPPAPSHTQEAGEANPS